MASKFMVHSVLKARLLLRPSHQRTVLFGTVYKPLILSSRTYSESRPLPKDSGSIQNSQSSRHEDKDRFCKACNQIRWLGACFVGAYVTWQLLNWYKENRRAQHESEKPKEKKPSIIEAIRQQWGEVQRIEDDLLCKILRLHLGAEKGDGCRVVDKFEGTYNRVHIMQSNDGSKYVIRVPQFGRPDRWTEADARGFRSQVLTMRYIKRHTKLPVPDVIAYSATCDNELGYAYMLMSFVEGSTMYEAWRPYSDDSPDLAKKRRRMLKSLARTMAELQRLEFPAGGMLYFETDNDDNPSIVPAYMDDNYDIHNPRHGQKHKPYFIPVEYSAKQLFDEGLTEWGNQFGQNMSETPIKSSHHTKAQWFVLNIIKECIPFPAAAPRNASENKQESVDGKTSFPTNGSLVGSSLPITEAEEHSSSAETFFLVPPDFDWQNILVDRKGNVTAIIDWDNVKTKHRFQGWISMPGFLRRDWMEFGLPHFKKTQQGHRWDGSTTWTSEHIEHYRKLYASYLAEVTHGEGDGIYAAKSHLFEAVEEAITCPHRTDTVIQMLLRTVLPPRTDVLEYLDRIGGEGWRYGERDWLIKRFKKLFECKALGKGVRGECNKLAKRFEKLFERKALGEETLSACSCNNFMASF